MIVAVVLSLIVGFVVGLITRDWLQQKKLALKKAAEAEAAKLIKDLEKL